MIQRLSGFFRATGFYLVAFGIFFVSSPQLQATACGATLDLQADSISLDSGWIFRKGDNLDWKDTTVDESFWSLRNLPDAVQNSSGSVSGYHWYRCKILVSEEGEIPEKSFAILLGKIPDIDETYFNGKLIGKTGTLIPIPDPNYDKVRIYSVPANLWVPGENTIAIRVYATGIRQGLESIPTLADEARLLSQYYGSIVLPVGFGFFFILMGLYLSTGVFIRGLRATHGFFGAFAIAMGLYTLIHSPYRYEVFSSFSASYVWELMVLVTLPALFLNFLIFHLQAKRNYFVLGNEIILGTLLLATPFMKNPAGLKLILNIFTLSLPLSLGLVGFFLFKHYRENRNKLKYILVGLVFLLPCLLIDSLTRYGIVSLPTLTYYGFFIFLVLATLQLSEEMISNLNRLKNLESDLSRMEQIKTGFLVNISNEFKSGIGQIANILEKMKSKNKKPTKSDVKAWDSLSALVQHTIAMIEEAGLLRKLESGEYLVKHSSFAIGDLIMEELGKIENRLEQRRKNLGIHIYPQEAVVHTDKTLISVIVRNLIENAYLYTDKSVRIEIEFRILQDRLVLSVSDEGIGMTIFEQEKLFVKFLRGDKGDFIPGAGIGLTVSKNAANALGGNIRVKTSEGMGSVFTVDIPIGE